jgi:hypothetical protein
MLSKKSVRGNRRNYLGPLTRFVLCDVRGPRRFLEKRPRTLVSALQSIAAAEWSKNQHLRDFWCRSIFDFFDSIDPKRTYVDVARPRKCALIIQNKCSRCPDIAVSSVGHFEVE